MAALLQIYFVMLTLVICFGTENDTSTLERYGINLSTWPSLQVLIFCKSKNSRIYICTLDIFLSQSRNYAHPYVVNHYNAPASEAFTEHPSKIGDKAFCQVRIGVCVKKNILENIQTI